MARLHLDWLTLIAGAVFLAMCGLGLFADQIDAALLHTDPNAQVLTAAYRGPSADHWFGTDEYGRDSAARVIQASRVSLTMGCMVAAIALTIGVAAGLAA